MKTQFWAIALVICATFVGSWGSLLLKKGVDGISLSILNIILCKKIFLGIVLYFISSLGFVWALKGGELSVLYPMVSLSYIWVTVMSYVFLNEQINTLKIVGVFLIIFGVILVGLGN